MFTVSHSAADAISQIVSNVDAPDGTGLRITADGTDGGLRLALAARPEPGDAIYDAGDARVFVDKRAGGILDGQVIDTAPAPDGEVQFVLGPGPG